MQNYNRIATTSAAAIFFIETAAVFIVVCAVLQKNILLAITVIAIASLIIPQIKDLTEVLLLKTAGLFRNQTVFAVNYNNGDILRLNVDGAYCKDKKLYISTHRSGLSGIEIVSPENIFNDDYVAAGQLYDFTESHLRKIEAVIQKPISEDGREKIMTIMLGEYARQAHNITNPPHINTEEFVNYLANRILTEENKKNGYNVLISRFC